MNHQTLEQNVYSQTASNNGIEIEDFYRILDSVDSGTGSRQLASSFAIVDPTPNEMTPEQKQKQLIIGLAVGLVSLIILTIAIASLRKKA